MNVLSTLLAELVALLEHCGFCENIRNHYPGATLAAIKFHHKDTKATKKSLCELGVFVVKKIFVVVIIFSE